MDIDSSDLGIVMQARKTILFNEGCVWVKKHGAEDFDVPMGSYDGAEVCELIGLLLLYKITEVIVREDVGLYRDDGLGVMKKGNKVETERRKKHIVKIFKDCGLSITIKCNLTRVNFLDVTFDVEKNTYEPYRKPNNTPLFINSSSNHPQCVKNAIPKSVETRLSTIASNAGLFDKHKDMYEKSLRTSGFAANLKYCKVSEKSNVKKKRRKRQITWFNPPFSMNVKSSVGKQFLKLVDKHFPKSNKLHKVLNRNTVKVSYSCTKNMASIMAAHNRRILKPNDVMFGCNCRDRSKCPLDGKCLTPQIVYKAVVTNEVNDEKKVYIGVSGTTFKERFRNHTRDITHKKYKTNTDLAKYAWDLKGSGINPIVKYECVRKTYGRPKENFCQLCLTEKLLILKYDDPNNLLNERTELFKKCRHTNKYLLQNAIEKHPD